MTVRTSTQIIVVCMLLAAGCRREPDAPAATTTTDTPLLKPAADRSQPTEFGLAFPPVDTARKREFTIAHLRTLNVRRIRFNDQWFFKEPRRGEYVWTSYDERMQWVKDNNLNVFLTIGNKLPAWAAAGGKRTPHASVVDKRYLADFRNYVSTLLKRYPGSFTRVQFGNEWHAPYCYPGTAEDYVRESNIVYEEVKKHCPEALFVLGGISIGGLRALAALDNSLDYAWETQFTNPGKKWRKIKGAELARWKRSAVVRTFRARLEHVLAHARYDALDVHLYDDVENWPTYMAIARKLAPGKPIIVSEFGGPNLFIEDYSDDYHAARVAEYIRVVRELGVPEAYYHSLVSNRRMSPASRKSGLITEELKTKPAYEVFRSLVADTPAATAAQVTEHQQ